jgi:hypothetical protein
MNVLVRMLATAPVLVILAETASSCGSASSGTGFDDSGTGGSSGGASSSGASGSSGDIGSSGGIGGSGTGLGGFGDGSAFGMSPDGAAQQCAPAGSTRSCCGGTQTCTAAGEFSAWGPCLGPTGAAATCKVPCSASGEGPGCDAGIDAPPPPPPVPPPPPALCTDPVVSTEPEILVGYEPAMGQTVGLTGQIKVWVNDENPPFIAPGEMVDNTTGAITAPGTRTATAADGLLYEPALYIAPQTPTNGGTPHFPQWIKGSYNNNPPTRGTFTGGAPMDPPPPGSNLGATYTGEFIWDVSTLGLGPGSYTAVFSVHDGDRDRAIGCVNIVITK